MRGAIVQYQKQKGCGCSSKTDAVEQAKVKHAEACELRVARRLNGMDPGFTNGVTVGHSPEPAIPQEKGV
jgi:hypothetical protein